MVAGTHVGKDHAAYQAIVNTLTMNAEDMKAVGIPSGSKVKLWKARGYAMLGLCCHVGDGCVISSV